jgi:hypothetical protein
MIEGLWTAVFSSGPIAGAGVIYLTDGEAVGGDSQYFYIGSYTFDPQLHALRARLQVTAFVKGAVTVFGAPIPSFTLELIGTVTGNSATAAGSVVGIPSVKMQLQLVKRSNRIMTEAEFKTTVKRTEDETSVTYDVRPFEEFQQEGIAWYLGSLIFKLSLSALNISKAVVLLVDTRFVSTPQLDGFVEKLKAKGLPIEVRCLPLPDAKG